VEFTLPYPPSANHYWRRVGSRTLISREGRTFRKNVCALLGGGGRKPPFTGRIALAMDAFPPDRRRRDLDNLLKSVQDSLAHAGVYEDDELIDLLLVRRREVIPGGRLEVEVTPLPLRRCPLCGANLN
jgi:crossover junction endodeoxyribonuclease RusA